MQLVRIHENEKMKNIHFCIFLMWFIFSDFNWSKQNGIEASSICEAFSLQKVVSGYMLKIKNQNAQ